MACIEDLNGHARWDMTEIEQTLVSEVDGLCV